MAISVEQESTRRGLVRLIFGVILVLGLFIATYVLFFTTPPQIEVLAPPEVETITQISEVDVSPSALVESAEFRSLDTNFVSPDPGEFGRSNPFARF